jgi:hypothetical protein
MNAASIDRAKNERRRAMKVALMLTGVGLLIALWLLLGDVPMHTRWFAISMCAFYGMVASWSAKL